MVGKDAEEDTLGFHIFDDGAREQKYNMGLDEKMQIFFGTFL